MLISTNTHDTSKSSLHFLLYSICFVLLPINTLFSVMNEKVKFLNIKKIKEIIVKLFMCHSNVILSVLCVLIPFSFEKIACFSILPLFLWVLLRVMPYLVITL